ncbi:MAG: Transcriptional activator (Anti-sigma factor) protein [Hyphomicrobiales bacterium]|nr:Transcriptional activator (Anti-sigma factor) protein [Hyphomicrobiales bacterium]
MDALLAAYCAGTLEPSLHALVASHLVLKRDSRSYVAALEALAADELAKVKPEPLSGRDERLKAIFDTQPAPSALTSVGSSILPLPLRQYLGRDLDAIRWRTKLPGVKECRVENTGRGEASFLWVKAGRRMPSHTHEGSEITLVLKGAFSDVTGHYARGDIAIADADLDHKPITDAAEDCICFAVTDAPLHLTGPFGRLVDRLFGAKR